MSKETFKRNKGITLIALVVTIIVLLILAGISIAMLTGQNGILNKASEAQEKTGIVQTDELVKLSVTDALTQGIGELTDVNLKTALNNNIGKGKYEISGDATNGWTITVNNKEYTVDPTGKVGGTTSGGNSGGANGIYPTNIDESKIAPQELFDIEPIQEEAKINKVASTGTLNSLPQKKARILRVKSKYCNQQGYNTKTGENDLEDTNYKINYEGITDTLIIPYQVEIDGELYKVTEVDLSVYNKYNGSSSFPYIENIIYPNTVEKIKTGNLSGNGDGNLKNVVLSTNITEIPNTFFSGCSELTNVTIPNGVSRIGYKAFYECQSISSIEIPDSVVDIDYKAFSSCKFSSIKIPDGVTNIGYAFTNCSNLSSVTYKGNTYRSAAELKSDLKKNGVTVNNYEFSRTPLETYDKTKPQ